MYTCRRCLLPYAPPDSSLRSTRPSGKDLSKYVEQKVIGESVYHIRYRRDQGRCCERRTHFFLLDFAKVFLMAQ
jgi:hypothetical protein